MVLHTADLKATTSPLPAGLLPVPPTPRDGAGAPEAPPDAGRAPTVHDGFLQSYCALRPTVLAAVKGAMLTFPGLPLMITGCDRRLQLLAVR